MTSPPVHGGTTNQNKTDSTNELYKLLRAGLLDYKNDNGDSARDVISERLYQRRPPDGKSLVFPYAIMSLSTSNNGRNFGMRLTGILEVLVHGRPWSQQEAVNSLCDLFDQAMLYFVRNTQGLVFCHASDRQPIPAGTSPVDGEVVTVRLSYTLAIWPAYLTSLTRVIT